MTDVTILASALVLATVLTYIITPLFAEPRTVGDVQDDASGRFDALNRQKAMVYQSIRDAELDRQTGKLSEEDYEEMVRSLKASAVSLMKEMDRFVEDGAPAQIRTGKRRAP